MSFQQENATNYLNTDHYSIDQMLDYQQNFVKASKVDAIWYNVGI